MPSKTPNDNYQWAGFPFKSGYQSWCDLASDGKNLACSRARPSAS